MLTEMKKARKFIIKNLQGVTRTPKHHYDAYFMCDHRWRRNQQLFYEDGEKEHQFHFQH
jgi:hypothetical protein